MALDNYRTNVFEDRFDVGSGDFSSPVSGLDQLEAPQVTAPETYNPGVSVESFAPQVGGLPTSSYQEETSPEIPPMAGAPSNVLSGNILAGASWNSLNPTLADELTQYTGLPTLNTAVGGATTADTLKQLQDFLSGGGSFAPGSNVFLQTGGVDLVQGLDKDTIQNNIDQIISSLSNQGANVVLTGSPYAASFDDVISNNFNPQLDSIYNNLAANRSNVSLVDSMGSILQNKDLLADPIHPNAQGWGVYNRSVIDALNELNNRNRTTEQG